MLCRDPNNIYVEFHPCCELTTVCGALSWSMPNDVIVYRITSSCYDVTIICRIHFLHVLPFTPDTRSHVFLFLCEEGWKDLCLFYTASPFQFNMDTLLKQITAWLKTVGWVCCIKQNTSFSGTFIPKVRREIRFFHYFRWRDEGGIYCVLFTPHLQNNNINTKTKKGRCGYMPIMHQSNGSPMFLFYPESDRFSQKEQFINYSLQWIRL